MLGDEEIARLLGPGSGSLEEMTADLVGAANEAGGRDNVSAVLLRYSDAG
jgi:protein phosphatase